MLHLPGRASSRLSFDSADGAGFALDNRALLARILREGFCAGRLRALDEEASAPE